MSICVLGLYLEKDLNKLMYVKIKTLHSKITKSILNIFLIKNVKNIDF